MTALPLEALAIPAFARKYGMSCSGCHTVWPKLNDNGQLFRDNGYRFNRGRDNPVTRSGDYWPLSLRTTVGYQYQKKTGVQTDQGFQTTQTGAFGFTGLDILTAGALGEQLSWLLVYTPGLNGAGFRQGGNSGGDLESAFVGFHRIAGTPYLNVRVGKHAPDLPLDEHRILTLTQAYSLYHYHPAGSTVTFEPGTNQVGVELYGHSELDRLRYSVSLLNENNAVLSSNIVSTPTLWGHVQGTHYLDNDFLAAVKAGVFGAVGFHPTSFSTTTAGPVDGTATHLKTWERVGGELHLTFLSTVFPLTLTGVAQYGTEDAALIANGMRRADWVSAFVEAEYTWAINWSVVARYDRSHSLHAGSTALPPNEGDVYSAVGVLRHGIELTARTAAAAQLEVSRSSTTTAAVPSPQGPPAGTTVLLAADFAF